MRERRESPRVEITPTLTPDRGSEEEPAEIQRPARRPDEETSGTFRIPRV